MGVRHSGRRSLALLVGTTTLWATACGGGGNSGSMQATRLPSPSRATPAAAHEVGPPTTLPWWSAGELHVGNVTIRTPMHDIVTRGATTLVGRATHGSTWLILRGDRLVPMVTTHPWGTRPVLSANGLHAAWTASTVTRQESLYEADQAFTVTAYDVRRGAVVGSTVIGSHTTCCDGGGAIDVVGVDDDGTVVIERYIDRGWTWRPGAEPVELGATVAHGLDSADQWPLGVSWTTGRSSDDPAALARVSRSGDLQRIGRVPQSQGGSGQRTGPRMPISRSRSSGATHRPCGRSTGGCASISATPSASWVGRDATP